MCVRVRRPSLLSDGGQLYGHRQTSGWRLVCSQFSNAVFIG